MSKLRLRLDALAVDPFHTGDGAAERDGGWARGDDQAAAHPHPRYGPYLLSLHADDLTAGRPRPAFCVRALSPPNESDAP